LNEDGSLYAVLGGSGGSRIFPAIAQVILNLDCGLDISAAIERPRVHNQIVPAETTIEVGPEGPDKKLMKGLRDRGHNVQEFDINLGVAEGMSRGSLSFMADRAVQGIVLQNGTIWAASDSRKNGIAAGY
jgi:gamma-glutamyltranspeptidase/glutathione hydrolase/leukotriene-C4 hydrolase